MTQGRPLIILNHQPIYQQLKGPIDKNTELPLVVEEARLSLIFIRAGIPEGRMPSQTTYMTLPDEASKCAKILSILSNIEF